MRPLLVLPLLLLPAPALADCVVLLHGLARSDASLLVLQETLEFHGYRVVNEGYPSEDAPIADLVGYVGQAAARCGDERLHFVMAQRTVAIAEQIRERERAVIPA